MSRKYLGIDIQHDALTAVLLTSGLKSGAVEECVHIPYTANEEGEPAEALRQALETLETEMNIDGETALLSLPMDTATYRNLVVPFVEPKKIRQVLPFELEPTLPVPIDSLVIDFQKIHTAGDGTKVLTASADTDVIKPFLDAALACHIDPEAITPGVYATARWLATSADMPEDWLLVDLTDQRCGIVVVHEREICMLRTFPVMGTAAVSSISRHVQQTMAGVDSLFLTSYLPDSVLMTGPGTDNDEVPRQLSEVLELPVRRPDLFDMVAADKKMSSNPGWNPGQMNNALACALLAADAQPCLNLRQGALAPKSRFLEYRQAMIRTGIIAAVAIVFACFNMMSELSILEKKSNHTKGQILSLFQTTFPDVRTIVEPLHQMRVKVQELKDKASGPKDMEDYLPAIDMLYALSSEISDKLDVRFTKLVAGEQNILISGTTDSFNSVNDMKSRLEKNRLFKVVKINSANMDRFGKRVRFKIKIQL